MYSLDTSLGFFGGYSALIWTIAALALSRHQEFSYLNSLSGYLYSTEKKTKVDKEFNEINKAESAVLNREPHTYSRK